MTHIIDDTDKTILNLLQDDATLLLKSIAEQAGISTATAQRRISALIDQKIIAKQVAIVDPNKVGYTLTVLVMIKMATSSVSMQQRFERIVVSEPQVMMCYEISGDYDFILMVNSQNMQDYHAFTRRFLTSENNVNHFNSQFVMNFIKSGTKITLK